MKYTKQDSRWETIELLKTALGPFLLGMLIGLSIIVSLSKATAVTYLIDEYGNAIFVNPLPVYPNVYLQPITPKPPITPWPFNYSTPRPGNSRTHAGVG